MTLVDAIYGIIVLVFSYYFDYSERNDLASIFTFGLKTFCAQGTLMKKTISPVPTAAQVRTVRKGSADHLSINIDSESEHLMNHNETDEDKGQN